ncbi:MAG TPA: hypothetical protein VGV90_18140 [Solirubrobacteraceae bacterium]|nr:hypothetical protein [Solirubrobacteraceae bacterium]
MTGEGGGGTQSPDGAAPLAPIKPLNGVALAKEVALQRVQDTLEWLLRRLKRYREKRGDWWDR